MAKQREADQIQASKRQSEIIKHKPTSGDLEESKSGNPAVEIVLLADVKKLKDSQWEQKQATENANKQIEI